jgi:hypothetical protein
VVSAGQIEGHLGAGARIESSEITVEK